MRPVFALIALMLALAIDMAAVAQTDPMSAPATGAVSAPGNTSPELDARGIPVISDPAEVPAGFNPPPGTSAGVPSTQRPMPQPATEDYPACSRTVTDNCVQGYETRVDCNAWPDHPRCRYYSGARRD